MKWYESTVSSLVITFSVFACGATGTVIAVTGGHEMVSLDYEVDALIDYGGGVSFTQTTIDTALTAIGTSQSMTLLLRPGIWAINANADWSPYTNVTFKIVPGAMLQVATGTTTTLPNLDGNGLHSGSGRSYLFRHRSVEPCPC